MDSPSACATTPEISSRQTSVGRYSVFGRVLHNWDLATKKMLLHKAFQALPKGGAVIVYDMLIDEERRSGVDGLLSSLNMLIWTAAGFGYSGASACPGCTKRDLAKHVSSPWSASRRWSLASNRLSEGPPNRVK